MSQARAQQAAENVIRAFLVSTELPITVSLTRYLGNQRLWSFDGRDVAFELDQQGRLKSLYSASKKPVPKEQFVWADPTQAITAGRRILVAIGEAEAGCGPVRVITPPSASGDWRIVSVLFDLWKEPELWVDGAKQILLIFDRSGRPFEYRRVDNIVADRAAVRLTRAQAIRRAVAEMAAWRKKVRGPVPTEPADALFGWVIPMSEFGAKVKTDPMPHRARLAWVVDFENMDRMYIDAHDGRLLGGLTGRFRQNWIETHYGRPSQVTEKPRKKQ